MDHSVDLSIPNLRKVLKKKGKDRSNKTFFYINAKQQIPVSYSSTLHIPPTNLLLLAAKQESYKKAYLLTKNIEEFSGKSSEERTSRQNLKIRQKG